MKKVAIIGLLCVISAGLFWWYWKMHGETTAELVAEIKEGYARDKSDGLSHPQTAKKPCADSIRVGLHDPYSAEITFVDAVAVDGSAIRATFVVRAKNGFNAYRVERFECMYRFFGTRWGVSSAGRIRE